MFWARRRFDYEIIRWNANVCPPSGCKVNTVGSSSSYFKVHAWTKQLPDQDSSFGFYFPKLIKSREEIESIYLLI